MQQQGQYARSTCTAVVVLMGLVSVARGRSIAVTEFLNHPGITGSTEWFELYNYGSTAVDLTGWTVTDHQAASDSWTLPEFVLASGSYVVLTGNKIEFEADWFGGVASAAVLQFGSGFALTDAVDEIILSDASSQVVWNVAWPNGETSGRATYFTGSEFSVTDFGTLAAPGVNRSGDDNGVAGFLGYQENTVTPDPFAFSSTSGDVGSPLAGSYSPTPAPGGLAVFALALMGARRTRRR